MFPRALNEIRQIISREEVRGEVKVSEYETASYTGYDNTYRGIRTLPGCCRRITPWCEQAFALLSGPSDGAQD